nr:hypothetical protein DMOBY_11070 [Dehalococcoides mccartyi]
MYNIALLLGGVNIYAIIESGGKQYKVTPGQLVEVDLLDLAEGDSIELDKVLMLNDGETVTIGSPTISGAKVTATVAGHIKGDKVFAYRFKAKTRNHKKMGHRQLYTVLTIGEILTGGAAEKPARKPRAKKTNEVITDGA